MSNEKELWKSIEPREGEDKTLDKMRREMFDAYDMSDLDDIIAETNNMTEEELKKEAERDAEEARRELAEMRKTDDLRRVVSHDIPVNRCKEIYASNVEKKSR